MKKLVYQQGNVIRNENGNIVGAVKGYYAIKEVKQKKITCSAVMKYLFSFCGGTAIILGVLEFCGRIGQF